MLKISQEDVVTNDINVLNLCLICQLLFLNFHLANNSQLLIQEYYISACLYKLVSE